MWSNRAVCMTALPYLAEEHDEDSQSQSMCHSRLNGTCSCIPNNTRTPDKDKQSSPQQFGQTGLDVLLVYFTAPAASCPGVFCLVWHLCHFRTTYGENLCLTLWHSGLLNTHTPPQPALSGPVHTVTYKGGITRGCTRDIHFFFRRPTFLQLLSWQ